MYTIQATKSLSDVQDILYYVFPHLDPDRSVGVDAIRIRQTLVRSAITCRSFTHPALNVLWKSLPSDKPLISLLCALGIAQDRSLGGERPPSYGLSASEDPRKHPNWHIFREYAIRVRKIGLDSSTDFETDFPRVTHSVWTEMSEFMADEPILPLLQSVNITSHNVPLRLISSSVRRMTVSFAGSTREWEPGQAPVDEPLELEPFLTEAFTRAPNLNIIMLSLPAGPGSRNLAVLNRNPCLRSITIQTLLKIEDLEPLVSLPELEYLSVVLLPSTNAATPLCFPSLQNLSVKGFWDTIRDLLESVEGPNIRSLNLYVLRIDPEHVVLQGNRCLQTVATKFPTLETLSVCCPRTATRFLHFRDNVDTQSSLVDIVEPLFSLHRLRHITLELPQFILQVSSGDIKAFGEAWQDVEELHIDVATADGRRAGFESVAHLARLCPRLSALRLPAMDLSVRAFDGVEYPPEPHPLRHLDVAEVLFPREVANLEYEMTVFIERVFPNTAIPFATHPIVVTDEESGERSRLV